MQLMQYDRLHCDGKGILELLLKETYHLCSSQQIRAVASRAAALQLPGLPSDGLSTIVHGKVTASEVVLMAQAGVVAIADCLPAAGRAIAGEWRPSPVQLSPTTSRPIREGCCNIQMCFALCLCNLPCSTAWHAAGSHDAPWPSSGLHLLSWVSMAVLQLTWPGRGCVMPGVTLSGPSKIWTPCASGEHPF